MVHFNWTQLIKGIGHEYAHVATGAVVSLLVVILAILGRLALSSSNIAPEGRLSLKGFFEVVLEFIIGLVKMVMGERGFIYVPLLGSLFIFILLNNLMGLVPGMTPATDNINTTLAIGIFAFVVYNFLGLREHGWGYLKHFLGPFLLLAPLMLPIELVSHLVRPASLGLRLFGNMTGDHAVLGIFLDLVPIGVPVIFYFLGAFVSFIQAFVFTLLTMLYISMATAHEH